MTYISDWPPRLALYKALAMGFSYPCDSLVVLLRQGHLTTTVRKAEEITSYGLAALPGLAGEYTLEELEVAYSHYFDIGWKYPPCPPYGGLYQNRNGRQMLLWELVQFYRHFGLAVSPAVKELPDHISVELEFMYYLVFKEYQAREAGSLEELEGYRLAQGDFLARYLSRCVPGFTARVLEKCSHSLYRDLAALLQQWVAGEERNFSKGA